MARRKSTRHRSLGGQLAPTGKQSTLKRRKTETSSEENVLNSDSRLSSGDDSDSELDVDPLKFSDVIGMPAEKFLSSIWGKKEWTSSISSDLLAQFMSRFGDGEITSVLPECRKEDNTTYSPEEMEALNKDFEESKKTLNLPLCFCEGADDLRNSFIED